MERTLSSVRLEYDRDRRTDLVITLTNGGRHAREEYRGSSLGDFEVIRHFGVLSIGGKEILDGYYASKLPE